MSITAILIAICVALASLAAWQTYRLGVANAEITGCRVAARNVITSHNAEIAAMKKVADDRATANAAETTRLDNLAHDIARRAPDRVDRATEPQQRLDAIKAAINRHMVQ